MDEHEVSEIRVRTNDDKSVVIRVREKCRRTEGGVEGIVYALLHPTALYEVAEYWAPIAHEPS